MLCVAAAAPPDLGHAGAWTLPQGSGLAIFSIDWIRNDPSVFGSANPNSQRSIKREARLYAEYGVTDWLTAVLQPELVNQHLDQPNRASYAGLGYTSLGLRARVLTGERFVLSLEGHVDPPGPSDQPNPAQAGETGPRYQAGINAGYSFELLGHPAFVDASFAYRLRTGRPPNEVRSDLTFGIRPIENWLILVQSFTYVTNGAGRAGFPEQVSSKLAFSLVHDFSSRWSAQLGVVQTIASRRVGTETGVIGAVWYRF